MNAVLTQRLVRVLCPNCRQAFVPRDELMGLFLGDLRGVDSFTFYQPKGCMHCNGTGFKGRVALQELLVINDPIREAILTRSTSTQLRLIARKQAGLVSMREDGFYKATQGVTTLEEVMRVVFHHENDTIMPRSAEQIMALCGGKDPAPAAAEERLPGVPEKLPPERAGAAFTTTVAVASAVEGEAYRVRFDANAIESETERIADFFEAYRRIRDSLGDAVDPELLVDFVEFIVQTVKRLRTAEGADFAEFSLHVRDKRERIFVETLVPPKDSPSAPATLETGLRQVGYLK